jgi:hypothetical protein
MAIPGWCGPVTKESRRTEEKNHGVNVIPSIITGRPHSVSQRKKNSSSSARKKTVKDEMTVQVKDLRTTGTQKRKSQRTEPKRFLSGPETETTVIVHETEGGDSLSALDCYMKNRGIVHRAMDLLHAWKYLPARIVSARLPVDIIALHKDTDILAQVISSKHPMPDVDTLSRNHGKKIDSLRLMDVARRYRKIVMSWSMPFGWKHYDVLPGGLIPAWDLHKLPVA